MLCACRCSSTQTVLEGPHHELLENVTNAASNGCRNCLHIRKELRKKYPVFEDRSLSRIALAYTMEDYGFDISVTITSKVSRSILPPISLHFCRSAQGLPREPWKQQAQTVREDLKIDPCRVRDDGRKADITANTRDMQALELARTWMNDCIRKHPGCHASSATILDLESTDGGVSRSILWPPKRLIDCSSTERLRLEGRDREQIKEGFATWSYCRGVNTSFVQLMAETEQDILRDEALLSVLPQTFRDAVEACHGLQVKYLWIDSVCIVQSGSGGKDWVLHAREMPRVYATCMLNIFPEHAKSPEEGFFRTRNQGILQRATVYGVTKRKKDGIYIGGSASYLSDGSRRTYELYDDMFHAMVTTPMLILVTRGRIVQERILSPRILHFTETHIAFSCYQTVRQEHCNERAIGYFKRFPSQVIHHQDYRQFSDGGSAKEMLWSWWIELV